MQRAAYTFQLDGDEDSPGAQIEMPEAGEGLVGQHASVLERASQLSRERPKRCGPQLIKYALLMMCCAVLVALILLGGFKAWQMSGLWGVPPPGNGTALAWPHGGETSGE